MSIPVPLRIPPSRLARLGAAFAIALPLAAAGCLHRATEPAASTIEEFNQRVQRYVSLSKRLEAVDPLPDQTRKPEKIVDREGGLAVRIRLERAGARPGDLFGPVVASHIRQVVASELRGPAGASQRSAIAEEDPERRSKVVLAVNADYPDTAPLSTVPPLILLRLPKLPEELDYRFVGRTMVLRDVKANLIVDYIENVIPPAKARPAPGGKPQATKAQAGGK